MISLVNQSTHIYIANQKRRVAGPWAECSRSVYRH